MRISPKFQFVKSFFGFSSPLSYLSVTIFSDKIENINTPCYDLQKNLKAFYALQGVTVKGGEDLGEFICTDEFITSSVEMYSDMMYRVAYNITKNHEDAYDVCQDVFVRLVRNKGKIKNNEHLKAWLLKATINRSKSLCTSAYKRHCVSAQESNTATTCDNYESSELFDAVMRLPKNYRTVIHLYYYEDLKIDEIAKAMKISKPAVNSRLHRGREILKSAYRKVD